MCDGHPQCDGGEDEDPERCYQQFVDMKIIAPYASLRCKSPLYKNMEIFGTPCDNITECAGGIDELGCKNNGTSNLVLVIASIGVLVLFLGLTFHQAFFDEYMLSKENQDLSMSISNSTKLMLEKYKEHFEEKEVINEVNNFLLNSIRTETEEENAKTMKSFYNLEKELMKYTKEPEIS